MDVYLLHAHDFRFLPYQVQTIRRHLSECKRIIVVQGPFRPGWVRDSTVMLSHRGADALGVELLQIDTMPIGGAFARQPLIYDQLLGREGVKLILHGDCIPDRDMMVAHLLEGHKAAGRAHVENGRVILHYTWLLANGPTDTKGVTENFRVWGFRVDDKELHTEYCEPGFWHLDKVSAGFRLDEKLAAVQARFGILPAPEVVPAEASAPGCHSHEIHEVLSPISAPTPVDRDKARLAICGACQFFRQADGRFWCERFDDNGTGRNNCPRMKHNRYLARITNESASCEKWEATVGVIINRITGTKPCIFHAPGVADKRRNSLWDATVKHCFACPPHPCDQIEVMLCSNSLTPCVLERLLQRNGQRHVVLGRDIRDWNHGWKHSLYKEHLQHCTTPYVMGLDGFDVVYNGDLHRAVELLTTLDKDWIFNGDYDCWPAVPIETPRCYAEVQQRCSDPASPWKYLNAGAWIAKTDYARQILGEARTIADQLHDTSEQKTYHYLFPTQPRMGIDYRCEVFQTEIREEILTMPDNLSRMEPAPCQACALASTSVATIEGVHSAVRDILASELKPGPFPSGPRGIVTTGEGRYEAGIVVMCRLARELGVTLPITVFHAEPWKTDMAGLGVTLVNSREFQKTHPAKRFTGWESKSYAVIHAGYERALFLDGDAYLIADPGPLFDALDAGDPYLYWADWGNPCDPASDWLEHNQNGGEYLVDLRRFWTQYQAIRFLDNNAAIFYAAKNRCGDECSTRWVRHLTRGAGFQCADWVRRTRGVGVLCGLKDRPPIIAHRMRRDSKLYSGTNPRRCDRWPMERRVFELFAQFTSPRKRFRPYPQAHKHLTRRSVAAAMAAAQ